VCFVAVLHGPLNYADGKLFFAQKTVPLIRTDYAKVVRKKMFVRIFNSYAKFTSRLECKRPSWDVLYELFDMKLKI